MKKTLLITNKTKTFLSLLLLCFCISVGWSQTILTQDSTCQEYTVTDGDGKNVDDNADAFDMTPNKTVKDDSGATIDSPYRYDEDDNPDGWYNSTLADWLETNCGDGDEQPGSSSDGNKFGPKAGVGRGLKLSEACRRLYQVVQVTPGTTYTFSIDSRGEADNIPSEIFMLNEEIVTEDGLENGAADTRVDAYMAITNDYNSTKSSSTKDTFTTTSFSFTATKNIVVVYVRTPLATSSTEVFFDNIELFDPTTASVKDNEVSDYFNIYPNPANGILNIQSKSVEVTKVEMYNVTGQRVLVQEGAVSKGLDVSSLSKGIYVLKISSTDNSFSQKIIIE